MYLSPLTSGRPRFTFWLTFFQSCMLPLFFSGLLSYLVGMKRMTSRCVTQERQLSLCSLCTYLPWRPRFTFWLTFLQSNISPLFLIGLLSYLVELKMRTSRRVMCKREFSLSPLCTYLPSHPRFTCWLTFFQSCMLPLLFNGLLSYLVGIKRRTSRHVGCKRDNSHFIMYLSLLMSKSCAGHNSYTFWDNLIIFGRYIHHVK